MPIDLYYTAPSAPCRAVLLTGATLNIDFDLKEVSLLKGNNVIGELSEENPICVLPTIVDKDLSLWESGAVIVYLAQKYDEREAFNLYPKDVKIQAQINKFLYFNLDTMFGTFIDNYYPILYRKEKLDDMKYENIHHAFRCLDKMLKESDDVENINLYAVKCWLTLADLALVATVSSFIACDYNIRPYEYVSKWYNTIKKAPNFDEANTLPLRRLNFLYKSAINPISV